MINMQAEDKEFLGLVASAVTTNPFSDQRVELDQKIAGADEQTPRSQLLGKALAVIEKRVQILLDKGELDLNKHSGSVRQDLELTLLFLVYHRYLDHFEILILQQIKAGKEVVPVPFARACIQELMRYGLSKDRALHALGLFYQLYRSFFFIDRGLVGRSSSMKQLRSDLWHNVFTNNIRWYDQYLWDRMEDFSTLLLGETGTGKGAAAAAIGRSGFIPFNERKNSYAVSFMDTFIAINLSQFSESLVESELFGHRKGAFTGAIEKHDGIFSRCRDHGSIFLDEIGDVRETIQIKLLQILQDRTYSAVGSHEPLRFRGRVIAATNKPIQELRRDGQFRDDFYYRLCSDVIEVPPLRARIQEDPQELDDLIDNVIGRMTQTKDQNLVRQVSRRIKQEVGKEYSWPGNVRELEQCIRRILLKGTYEQDKTLNHMDKESSLARGIQEGLFTASDLLEGYCNLMYQRLGSYEEVARHLDLDRRTVKKYIHLKKEGM